MAALGLVAWAPRFQTIEPPFTFAGVAITVLCLAVLGYHEWVVIEALVARVMEALR